MHDEFGGCGERADPARPELPPRPEPPDPLDCCGVGCEPCIFDLYQDELEAWERRVAEIEGAGGGPAPEEQSGSD